MGKVAIIIGASGLVGRMLLEQLLNHSEFEQVKIFVRRKTDIVHSKLQEEIINFKDIDSWKHLVQGDVFFSTMGTTIKKAKTKENQYRVDFTYQHEFAKVAAENGVSTYVLVSSIGADSKSSVFYTRMKGELDEAVSRLNFKRIVIFRPSFLDGNRPEVRVGERIGMAIGHFVTRFVFRNYKPIPISVLAARMISYALDEKEGIRTIEGREIFRVNSTKTGLIR
jgi:uncharacterized protein YbjT (DUF2867 family)